MNLRHASVQNLYNTLQQMPKMYTISKRSFCGLVSFSVFLLFFFSRKPKCPTFLRISETCEIHGIHGMRNIEFWMLNMGNSCIWRTPRKSVGNYLVASLPAWGLLSKERICSKREELLTFKSSPYNKGGKYFMLGTLTLLQLFFLTRPKVI